MKNSLPGTEVDGFTSSPEPKKTQISLKTKVGLIVLLSALLLLPSILVTLSSLSSLNQQVIDLTSTGSGDQAIQEYTAEAKPTLTTALRDGISLLMLGSGLVLLLALFMPRKLLSPLSQLTRVMRQTQRGDVSAQVEVKKNDELGELAIAFNRAMARLRMYDRLKTERIISEGQRVAMLAEHLTVGMAIADPDFLTIVLANSRLTSIAGRGLAGKEIHEVIRLNDESIDKDLREVALLREPLTGKMGIVLTTRGKEIPVQVDLDFSRNAAGETGTVAVFVRRVRRKEVES